MSAVLDSVYTPDDLWPDLWEDPNAMGKHTNTWKRAERQAAKLLGGQRVGATGQATADVESDWAVCEVKTRRTLPQWLKDAVRQAEGAATRYTTPRVPLVQLHEVGGRVVDDLIVMRAGEFRAWYGNWRGASDLA